MPRFPKSILVLPFVAVTGFVACSKTAGFNPVDGETQTVQDTSDATTTTLDASDQSEGTTPLAFSLGGPRGAAAGECTATRTTSDTTALCQISYPGKVQLAYACTRADGVKVSGSAAIVNTVSNTAPGQGCPATTIAVDREINLSLSRTFLNGDALELGGTANVLWTATVGDAAAGRSRQLTYNLNRDAQDAAGTPILKQVLTTPQAITVDYADDVTNTRTLNGENQVQHELAGFTFQGTATNLEFKDTCCYPVSGTYAWDVSGSHNASGSITFASCGVASDEAGNSLVLPACL